MLSVSFNAISPLSPQQQAKQDPPSIPPGKATCLSAISAWSGSRSSLLANGRLSIRPPSARTTQTEAVDGDPENQKEISPSALFVAPWVPRSHRRLLSVSMRRKTDFLDFFGRRSEAAGKSRSREIAGLANPHPTGLGAIELARITTLPTGRHVARVKSLRNLRYTTRSRQRDHASSTENSAWQKAICLTTDGEIIADDAESGSIDMARYG